MKINNRLKNVANFVLKDSNVIDVGCDHALLCIYLASNYPNMRLIASDVREGPLKQAKAKDLALFKLVRELRYKTDYKFIDDTSFIVK